ARELAQHFMRAVLQRLKRDRARVQRRHAARMRSSAGDRKDAPRRRSTGGLDAERRRIGRDIDLLQALIDALRERHARHQPARNRASRRAAMRGRNASRSVRWYASLAAALSISLRSRPIVSRDEVLPPLPCKLLSESSAGNSAARSSTAAALPATTLRSSTGM